MFIYYPIHIANITRVRKHTRCCLNQSPEYQTQGSLFVRRILLFQMLKGQYSIIHIYVNTSIRKSNATRVPMALVRRNGGALSYNRSIHFKCLWSLSDQNLQKGKCLTNDIFRFERMNMCRSFVALTRRAFVQTFILPSSNAEKQHCTQRSEGPFVFCLTRHDLTYSPHIFSFFSKWNTVFHFRSLLKIA